jgi:Tol biopolymer transport system component
VSNFFSKLNRRGVIKIGVAYLAVGWLLLQVIDVVGGIFVLPTWLARFTFFALLIGFPFALVLAWVYDMTPEGIVATDDSEVSLPQAHGVDRKINLIIIGSLTLIIALLGGKLLTGPPPPDDLQETLAISDYRQLTTSQFIFPPTPSPYPLVSDASRLYFNDWNNGLLGLRQLLHSGGEAERIESPFDDGRLLNPNTMTPDGANLVVGAFNPAIMQPPDIWHLPVGSGDPRFIGPGTDVSYSADGTSVVYVTGMADLSVANADLSNSRKLTSPRGRVHWARFSPDMKTVRYSVHGELRTIWEIELDGGEPKRVFPEWEIVDHCCGNWTPDGKYFVFQATVDYRTQIWAMPYTPGQPGDEKPTKISTGAIDFRRPTISPDGRQIFAVGWQLRGEVVHFDPERERTLPLDGFESTSAEWLAFSSDSSLVAYVSYPKADLWRSDNDGSRKLQLTFPPMRASNPVWSPDQRRIAFRGQVPREPWRIYVVSAEGGVPTPLGDEVRPQRSPSWSPDGLHLAFNEAGSRTIRTFNSATGAVRDLPGSEGLFMPRWMPDGKSIAALTRSGLVLFKPETRETRVLVENIMIGNMDVSVDGQYVYVVNPSLFGPDRAVLRVAVADGAVEKVTGLGDARIPWGTDGMWVGITPNGEPMMLRDLSIHHIYALGWPAGNSGD